MAWVGFAFGIFVVGVVGASVVFTLVVPRSYPSRISVFVGRRLVRSVFLFVADRFEDYETKDRILALSGPIALLVILAVWVGLFVVGFALMLWPVGHHTFAGALREGGSSVFTLGFAATPRS